MMRGINRQNLFEDEEDKTRFLDTLFRYRDECGEVKITSWCLMDNHVHLLINSENSPDQFIKKLGCSYVPYFNRKYGRVGHLFQDRFRSEAVNDDRYLLAVVRYIHRNPEKAGICRAEDYVWSSYQDYVTGLGKTDTALILEMLSGRDGFKEFMQKEDETEFLEDSHGLTEQEAIAAAKDVLPEGLFAIQTFERKKRNEMLRKLSARGLTAVQISRITGIAKSTVYSIL